MNNITRRGFLTHAAGAAAASFLLPSVSFSNELYQLENLYAEKCAGLIDGSTAMRFWSNNCMTEPEECVWQFAGTSMLGFPMFFRSETGGITCDPPKGGYSTKGTQDIFYYLYDPQEKIESLSGCNINHYNVHVKEISDGKYEKQKEYTGSVYVFTVPESISTGIIKSLISQKVGTPRPGTNNKTIIKDILVKHPT